MKSSLVLIIGASGSGVGSAARIFEDLGFNCIDSLPFDLLEQTIKLLEKKENLTKNGVVVGVKIFLKNDVISFLKLLNSLKKRFLLKILFLKTDSDVLLTRFNTTRRFHPLAKSQTLTSKIIEDEKAMLSPLLNFVDVEIDTTELSPIDLARHIEGLFIKGDSKRTMFVSITSFGFKYGLCNPLESLYDVRFLKNPFFSPALKTKNGLEKEVINFFKSDKDVSETINRIKELNLWLLPRYYKEGKSYFRIGVGCTGGFHRSVFIAQSLKDALKAELPVEIRAEVYHRDIRN